jgi:hypothetical protein
MRPPDEAEPAPPPVESAEPALSADDLRERLAKAETIEQIVELVIAAANLANAAAAIRDLAGFRIAREIKLRAERVGGAMLLRTIRAPVSKLKIGNVSPRWRELAGAEDREFEQRIATILKSTAFTLVPMPHSKVVSKPAPAVIQRITAWATDEAGNLCRSLVTEGEQPRLQGERGSPEI